jgi:hypothetical protein
MMSLWLVLVLVMLTSPCSLALPWPALFWIVRE